jgi:predicted CoA-binding protein
VVVLGARSSHMAFHLQHVSSPVTPYQSGVTNQEGARIAEDADLTVIMDRSMKAEHARYVGPMHWLGFNTNRITSVRGNLR